MTGRGDGSTVQFARIDRIRILNPRERDKKKFLEIVDSIRKVGLKQPINRTVRPRTVSLKAVLCQIDPDGNGGEKLVHGSGGIVSLRAEQNSAT